MALPFALKAHAIEQLLLMVWVYHAVVHTMRASNKHQPDCGTLKSWLHNCVILGKLLFCVSVSLSVKWG